MFQRELGEQLKKLFKQYPIVTILGSRHSGKTTLAKALLPHLPYVNLEDPNTRNLAMLDPTSFMESYQEGAIFDEVQRVPELLSFIQVLVDKKQKDGMFLLTGSHQAQLHSAVAQSLAGRTAILRLLPLSYKEIKKANIQDPIEEILLKGGYPRIYDKELSPSTTYSSYFQTYVERDVRQILKIKDLVAFERFIKLLASRVGQLINYASLASDVGVSAVTIKEWISVLEATYILIRLEPYYENFGKRLIKAPKIYFTDTGLICYLLGIESKEQLMKDSLFGSIFENFVFLELMKSRYNQALDPRLYFYRDVSEKEVDLIFQKGSHLIPIEIKSSTSISPSHFNNLSYFHAQAPTKASGGALIYRGDQTQKINQFHLCNIENCDDLIFS